MLLRHKFEGHESKRCQQCDRSFFRDTRCTNAYWAKAKFCSRACFGKHHAATAEATRRDLRTEFNRWVDKSGECWVWTGGRDKDGYGVFHFAGKTYRANKVALELDGRPARRGQYACHHCDNPPCVRPDHLYPGTPTQNSSDAKSRGRISLGENSAHAKLTEADVRYIRACNEPCGAMAKRFGVTHGAVSMARSGKTWGHVK